MRIVFATAFCAVFLSGCGIFKPAAFETERQAREVCISWGTYLPTISREDTTKTQIEVQTLYAAFSLVCPTFDYLIPE